MALSGHVHRPSTLKQKNKKHNVLGHRSKRQVLSKSRGRVDVKAITKNFKRELSREQRKNQAKQIRSNKRKEAYYIKRQLGSELSPPFLVTVIPLSKNINGQKILENITTSDDHDTSVQISQQGIWHLSCSRLKQRFSFVSPHVFDFYAVLDAARCSDTIIFLWKVGETIDSSTDMLLSSIVSQGISSRLHAVVGEEELGTKKKQRILKELQIDISSRFPDHGRLYFLNKAQDISLLLRQIGAQKQRSIFYKDQRSHLIGEKILFEREAIGSGTLKVQGYIRSQPLSVNSLIHIPGWGEFQLSRIDSVSDPYPLLKGKRPQKTSVVEESVLLEFADPKLQESLQSTYEVDPLEEEQTWPTEEEIKAAKEDYFMKKKKKCPRGCSEYQAAWILEDSEEESDEDSDESSAMEESFSNVPEDDLSQQEALDGDADADERDSEDEKSSLTEVDLDYDRKMDYDEDMEFLEKMKAAREDAAFPDEVDTPMDIPARTRFQKYRGLQSFRTSPWNKDENLPDECRKIISFRNFKHTTKRIFKESREGSLPGWYVMIYIKNVPEELYLRYSDGKLPLTLYSLMPYEQKMSLIHLVVKSHPSGHLRPIKSKETLIFHVGFRRFINAPIFSEHSSGDKHKYFRFFHPGQIAVATIFAPVTFPPCPVTVFRLRPDGAHELVATGSFSTAGVDRVICKRIVLSGHPFKVNRKSAVVRYMFFNREDIQFFKPIELRTKWGRRGHIKEPLGTHGHMKCQFDGQLKSQDTVLMNLYKRVFPKWRYEPTVPHPPPLFFSRTEEEVEIDKFFSGATDFETPKLKKKKVQFF